MPGESKRGGEKDAGLWNDDPLLRPRRAEAQGSARCGGLLIAYLRWTSAVLASLFLCVAATAQSTGPGSLLTGGTSSTETQPGVGIPYAYATVASKAHGEQARYDLGGDGNRVLLNTGSFVHQVPMLGFPDGAWTSNGPASIARTRASTGRWASDGTMDTINTWSCIAPRAPASPT